MNADVRTESLSGCQYGEANPISGGAWNAPTEVHTITEVDAIDSVWLHLWNRSAADVAIKLILNADNTSAQASVDASTTTVIVPAESDVWVLQGDRFRVHGSGNATYTIGAYYSTGASGDVVFTGHIDRMSQGEVIS